jgi:hypothetical protein
VDPITAALQFGRSILERWIPDKTERAKAEAEMAIAVLNGDLQLAAGQLEVNKAEAGHASVFVAGWRPAVGWVCAAALAWQYFGRSIAMAITGAPIEPVDMGDLLILLLGMLGLTTARTVETMAGKARQRI